MTERPATVLLVEDNPVTRQTLSRALAKSGFMVLEAASGYEALARLPHRPDVIVQSNVLPDMDGAALTARLRAEPGLAALPVLGLCGPYDEPCGSGDIADQILKPVDPERLVRAVDFQLRRTSAPDELSRTPPPARARVWTSVSAVLERLWELVLKPSSEEQAVSDILASLLDACGFSRGAAYLFDGEGALWLRARFGFSDQLADGLRHFWGRQRVLEKVASGGEPVVLTRTSAPSGGAKLLEASKTGALVLQPLSAGTTPVGVLMMACDRGDPPAEALVLARSMAGPISQAVILARSIAHVSSSQRQLATVTRAMSDGLLEVDPAGIVRYANAPAIAMLGLAGDVTGLPLAAVAPQIPQRPGAEVCHLPAVHGPDRQIEVSGASFEDPSGASGLILTLRDVSSRMAPEEIGRIANHDPLTGLFNRRRLEEELSSRLAESRRYQTEGALLALSLDRLAAVRDTYGQASADAVVRGVADVLRAQTREVDVIARKGGDEIVLLLNHAGREGALVCAAKVRDAIRGLEVTFAGRTLKIGVSIGVALFPDHGTQPEEILGAAEQALRTAQKAGRDGVHLHSAPPPPP